MATETKAGSHGYSCVTNIVPNMIQILILISCTTSRHMHVRTRHSCRRMTHRPKSLSGVRLSALGPWIGSCSHIRSRRSRDADHCFSASHSLQLPQALDITTDCLTANPEQLGG